MRRFRLFTVMLAAALPAPVAAQTDSGTMLAPILRTERAGAGVIRIVYDLRGVTGSPFTVTLEASDDDGQTFTIRPHAISGDVGPGISPGAEKTIAWDSAKDIDNLQVDRYVFRVRVAPGGRSAVVAPSAPASGAGAPAGGTTAGGQPGGGTTSGAAKRGGLGKGAIYGIVGGAAAAGVGIAATKGSSSTPSTPSTSQTRNVTGPYSVSLSVVTTNPDGSAPCTHVEVPAGNLTMTLDVIAGSVTGTATFQGTMTAGATTCTNDGIPSPTPGSVANASVGNIPVTGTPSSMSFNRQVVSQSPSNGGALVNLTLTFSFTGVLNSDTVSGSLTISYRGEVQPGPSRIGLGTGTVVVTLR